MSNKFFTYGEDNTGALLSTTVSAWMQTKLEDQVFNQTPLLKKLYENKLSMDGGASILVPILYEDNGTTTAYEMYDVLDTTPQDGMANTQAKWKNIATSISVAGEELRMNSGKSKIVSLMEGKTMQAELSLQNYLTTKLFASSTGSKDPESLAAMIDATSTIQDINSTSNSFWQAVVTTGGSFAGKGLSDMRTTWTTISKRNPATVPDVLVTTDTIYNYYEGALQPQARYASTTSADGSFENLKFKTATVFYDANCTSGVMYMFSTKNLKLVVNSNADYKKTEFVKPSNQDAMVAQVILMCQLVTNARRKLGKINSITA